MGWESFAKELFHDRFDQEIGGRSLNIVESLIYPFHMKGISSEESEGKCMLLGGILGSANIFASLILSNLLPSKIYSSFWFGFFWIIVSLGILKLFFAFLEPYLPGDEKKKKLCSFLYQIGIVLGFGGTMITFICVLFFQMILYLEGM